MKLILLLVLCAVVTAQAGPSVPTVKRQGPLRSPRHAEAVKVAGRSFSPAGGDLNESRLPCKGSCVVVTNSQFGSMEFTAEAMAPANQSVLFEYATDMPPTGWTTLAWFGSYYKEQQVFAMVVTDEVQVFIRATAQAQAPAGLAPVLASAGGSIKVNSKVSGARAWRGK